MGIVQGVVAPIEILGLFSAGDVAAGPKRAQA
jgi:hypothetical protein